jgi:deoxyhypusine synthase
VTTAGGIEEDIIKCLAPTYLGDFHLRGKSLREIAINRIGNLLIPNDNYCMFERWIMPILDQLLVEQRDQVTTKYFVWLMSRAEVRSFRQQWRGPESCTALHYTCSCKIS